MTIDATDFGGNCVEYEVEIVKRVKDADGAACRECETWFDRNTDANLPWSWRNSKWMHERGTGHRMELYRVVVAA
jgi:hypothetical protein